jgi:hypothetical protein
MPIDRPADVQRGCAKSPREIMPIESRAVDQHQDRTDPGRALI